MQVAKLSSMKKGWFIGNFSPTVYATEAVEVAVKEYPAGFQEEWHYHKVAAEFTVIVSGEVEMNGRRFIAGDIIVISPGEGTDFRTFAPTVTTVVKIPGATNDKFLKGQ
jgi:mannose-6-phosphate isomerase-like protein (cupin superfamily)